jgi:hypothetical protein
MKSSGNLSMLPDKPDPEIDRIWAEEARKRWAAYKAGKIPTVAYEDVMAKHRRE